jgi:uncharacterized membrane protein HdeD (DUF308 family)
MVAEKKTATAKVVKPRKVAARNKIKTFDISGYVNAHWGGFMFRAVLALAFGVYCLFVPEGVLSILTGILAIGLLCLGLFELVRSLVLYKRGASFGFALVSGGLEVVFGAWLMANAEARFEILAVIIALIAIARGLFDLFIAVKRTGDAADRFTWVVSGLLGILLGILIFVVPSFGWATNIAIIWIFGVYLLVVGLSNAFYALHLREKSKKKSKRA